MAGHGESLLGMFIKLVNRYNLAKNTRFSFSNFLEVYQETVVFNDIPIAEALKVLYEAGIMCVHTNSRTYWYFRENPKPFDFEVWKEAYFELHKGLWKKVQIW